MLIRGPTKKFWMPGIAPYYSAAVATTTWNPSDKAAAVTLSGGNLAASFPAGGFVSVRTIGGRSSGKAYFSTVTTVTTNLILIGISNSSLSVSGGDPRNTVNAACIASNSNIWANGVAASGGTAIAAGDVVDVAIDVGAKLLWYRVNNGAWQGNGGASPDPATGTNGCNISGLSGAAPYFVTGTGTTGATAVMTANFGGSAFTNPAPSGFGNW